MRSGGVVGGVAPCCEEAGRATALSHSIPSRVRYSHYTTADKLGTDDDKR